MRRTVVLLATMVLTLLVASGVALAALGNTADSGTVGANGRVWDILRAGDKVYLAGAFTQITDKDGTTFQRNNLAAVDAATGQLTSWNPSATNPNNPGMSSVRSMALSSDGTRLFVGGAFTRVGGVPRSRLAAINPLTGTVDGGWNASVDRPVHALIVSAKTNKLYLGGDFTTVAGQPREQLAAVDAATGALDPNWQPSAHRGDDNPKNAVWAMDVSDDGTRIYVGGFFNHISGQQTGKLAALDTSTGAVIGAFNPATFNNILAMDVSGGRIFVGTADPLEGIEAFDATTGQRYWSVPGGHPDPEAGDVQAIVASGGKVYAGGHYAQMGGLVRKRLCEVDALTGQIGPWAPQIPGFQAGNLGVWALEVDPALGRLYAGGDFLKVSGQDRQRFAQFSGL
jgi:outer membrane protein assembly factor BamB